MLESSVRTGRYQDPTQNQVSFTSTQTRLGRPIIQTDEVRLTCDQRDPNTVWCWSRSWSWRGHPGVVRVRPPGPGVHHAAGRWADWRGHRAQEASGDPDQVSAGPGGDAGVSFQHPQVSTHSGLSWTSSCTWAHLRQVSGRGQDSEHDTETVTPRKQGGGPRKSWSRSLRQNLEQITLFCFSTNWSRSLVFKLHYPEFNTKTESIQSRTNRATKYILN